MLGIIEIEGKKRPVIVCERLADVTEATEWRKTLKEAIETLLLMKEDSIAETLLEIAEELDFSDTAKETAIDAYFNGTQPLTAVKQACTLSI